MKIQIDYEREKRLRKLLKDQELTFEITVDKTDFM